jgi:hypothetical protein
MASFNQSASSPQVAPIAIFDTQSSVGSSTGNAIVKSAYQQDRYGTISIVKISAMGIGNDFPGSAQQIPATGQIWPSGF